MQGRLLTGTVGALLDPVPADPAEPVILVSSSSSITMGCSISAMVASEEVDGPEVGRGRSKGDALKILATSLIGTWSASRPSGLMRSS